MQVQQFIGEWDELRPVHKKSLANKVIKVHMIRDRGTAHGD
jgi:hypothetical protein